MNVKPQILLVFFVVITLTAQGGISEGEENREEKDLFRHTPVARQQRLVPIPIYVEVHDSVPVSAVILYYRTPGEKIFQQVRMDSHGKGYAATIGCDVLHVLDPSSIAYYIALKDEGNQLRGTLGTEVNPYQVVIVDQPVEPPLSLPGNVPPGQCEDECPPWNPNCKVCKGESEVCTHTRDCCPEMTCQMGACFPQSDRDGNAGFKPSFRLAITFGTGAGVSNKTMMHPYNQVSITPDHIYDPPPESGLLPPENIVYDGRVLIPTTFGWSNLHFRINPMFYLNDLFLIGLSFRGGLTVDSDSVHGDHTLSFAPTILAVVAFRIVGNRSDTFELDAQFGLGAGVIYHKINYTDCRKNTWNETYEWDDPDRPIWYNPDLPPPQSGCSDESLTEDGRWNFEDEADGEDKHFYLQSGKFVAEVGFDSYIWIIDNFGINIGLMIDAYMGSHFALNFDIQVGPSVRF